MIKVEVFNESSTWNASNSFCNLLGIFITSHNVFPMKRFYSFALFNELSLSCVLHSTRENITSTLFRQQQCEIDVKGERKKEIVKLTLVHFLSRHWVPARDLLSRRAITKGLEVGKAGKTHLLTSALLPTFSLFPRKFNWASQLMIKTSFQK